MAKTLVGIATTDETGKAVFNYTGEGYESRKLMAEYGDIQSNEIEISSFIGKIMKPIDIDNLPNPTNLNYWINDNGYLDLKVTSSTAMGGMLMDITDVSHFEMKYQAYSSNKYGRVSVRLKDTNNHIVYNTSDFLQNLTELNITLKYNNGTVKIYNGIGELIDETSDLPELNCLIIMFTALPSDNTIFTINELYAIRK